MKKIALAFALVLTLSAVALSGCSIHENFHRGHRWHHWR